jgi:stage V sporulation protein G
MQSPTALFSSVRITLANKESQKALASLKVADAMFLTGMRVIEGKNGLFVSMPSKKDAAGDYHDIYFPASREMRDLLQLLIIDAYREELMKAGHAEEVAALAA